MFEKYKAAKLIFLIAIACLFVFGDAIAPYEYAQQARSEPNAPAARIRFRDADGSVTRPFVYRRVLVDRLNFGYEEDRGEKHSIILFGRGNSYLIANYIPANVHLFGTTDENVRLTLLGTDMLGRDRFSRLIVAIRFSLIVCLAGTILASAVGIFVGMVSGYSGRTLDSILMGITDSVLALPSLIVILAARAAFPLELPAFSAGILLILIFALTGWGEMARLARGLVKTAREQEYVQAAKAVGSSRPAVLFRHIFPNIAPSLITQATIMLPYFLLSEVALSYLGVGLQEPVPSLGNMLAAAGDLARLQQHPILLLSPAIVIFIFVFVVRLFSSGAENARRNFTVS